MPLETLQAIGVGSAPGDGTGDPGRTAFQKVNYNFALVAGAVQDAEIKAFTVGCTAQGVSLEVAETVEHFHIPYAFVLLEVQAGVAVAPTGDDVLVDVLADGYTVLDSNMLAIEAGSTFGTAAVPDYTILEKGSEITFDVNQIGSTEPGEWLKITLVGFVIWTSY